MIHAIFDILDRIEDRTIHVEYNALLHVITSFPKVTYIIPCNESGRSEKHRDRFIKPIVLNCHISFTKTITSCMIYVLGMFWIRQGTASSISMSWLLK